VYRQFDVLVVPSLWPENSPLVIHEAFMAAVPVIAARTGGIPELVTDEVSGMLCEPGSTTDLARAIRRFVDRPALVATLAAGAPPVKSMASNVVEWDEIYRTLVDCRERTA
jgi:glycosyltransferase involved in cell wall biosynthesis